MWPPLLCPSFSRAVTACWHDLEYNHRVVMTQRWILGWPAEPPPAATQHDVALCPCLLFFLYVHLFGCVCACVNASACGREGVAHSTDTIRKQLLGDLHIGQSVSQSADDEMQIATESETVKCERVCCACTCGGICMSPRRLFIFVFSTPRAGKWPVSCDYICGNQKWRGNCEIYLKEL